jgi:pimeloyl-ACP methyl ester carboxylesterase
MTNPSLYKSAASEQAVMASYEAILQNWPVPFTTHMLATHHGNTFLIACGDEEAAPLVLLHGAGGNSTMWAGDIEHLCRRFRVYLVDLIGEAGKSDPVRPSWDSSAFAEWLEDVFDGLKLEQATLVGLSQGGWTALKFAVTAPHRVTKLVLIAPGGIIADRLSFVMKAIGFMMLGQRGAERLVKALFGNQAVPEEVVAGVAQTMAAFKPRAGILPIFTDVELRQLTMPVLLLGGTQDIIRDMTRIARRMEVLVPTLTVKIVPGGGHALLATASHLTEFLGL